jgi:hypothetical protein
MEISVAGIDIHEGKAYMPVMGRTDSGLFINTEPVFICDLSIEEMAKNLQKVREAGHPLIHIGSSEELKKYTNLIPKASGVKSWKAFARTGFSYTIGWSEKGILIEMSRLDKRGIFEFDPTKAKELPLDTPIKDIVQIILDDVWSRPQVL